VSERVLHQRLEQHARHPGAERRGVDVADHRESVPEAHCLQIEIKIEMLQLALERDLTVRARLQRDSQEIAQPEQHSLGAPGVVAHQRRDCVEGVEEEVRLQLEGERLQAGQYQRALQRLPLANLV
jgi:hypothetical protein